MRRLIQIALLMGAAASLAGCDSIRAAAGNDKESPDEFAVVTKAPLVIPPDFNLRPPAPGTAPANQVEPTQAAQAALFSADPATVAASLPATMSAGERYLLANAGVQNADPAIRQQLASDAAGMRGSDDSFTNAILFGDSPSATGAKPVDADAEARRIEAARAGGTAPAAPAGSAAPPAPDKPSDSSKDDDDWLGHLWPF
ncbi:MAG TPA: DUF3035 domain-containing protein [Rhizomicrobium sp.]|nr:DUF3035 domain-containing protein [Rhizomicrobium sp.]